MNNNDLLNKYQRGIINHDELIKENNKINSKKDLDEMLSNKLEREFKEFRKKLLKENKEKILDSAYEITVKEEIKEELKNMELYEKEKEIMFLQDDLLNEFYKDWLDCDVPLRESLRDNLQESIAVLTRYYKGKSNESKER